MKRIMFLLVFLILSGASGDRPCFSQGDDSGVIVYGGSDMNVDEEDFDPESIMPVEITGSSLGDSMVSEAVTLSREGRVSYAYSSMGRGITIVSIDGAGVERQFYCFDSPEQAVGKKMPKGTYKVYPNNPNSDSNIGEITATISVEPVRDKQGGEE